MLLLCALRMRQRVRGRNAGRRRDGGVLREDAWGEEEEEQEEGEMAGRRRWAGLLRGWRHGGGLSSEMPSWASGMQLGKRGDIRLSHTPSKETTTLKF